MNVEQMRDVVADALSQHVRDEQAELDQIARVMHRLADAIDVLRWCALLVLLVLLSLAGVAGFNLHQTTRNAPRFIAEHVHTQTILCTRILSTDPAPPAEIVQLCEGRNG